MTDYATIKEVKGGKDGGFTIKLVKLREDKLAEINFYRSNKAGKEVSCRAVLAEEWPWFSKQVPVIQKELDKDAKVVEAAKKKAKGNGGTAKKAATKAPAKTKAAATKKATTSKKAPAKKTPAKTTVRKVITRKAPGRKKAETSIDDLL